jgi:site-specific DNA recombinase
MGQRNSQGVNTPQGQSSPEKCAIYTRVSTLRQVDKGMSLSAQKERLTETAKFHHMEIFDMYTDEGFSATNTKRPDLKRMLSDAKAGSFTKLLIYKIDRLSRSVLDFHNMVDDLLKHGVNIMVEGLNLDTSTSTGALTINVLAAFAAFESDCISERTRESLAVNKAHHLLIGRLPYGYAWKHGVMVRDDAKLRIVGDVYDKYLAGMPVRTIATKLHEKDHTVTRDVVRDMLSNPVYAGKVSYGRRKAPQTKAEGKKYSPVKPLVEWSELQDLEEKCVRPAISFERWKEVQSMRENSASRRTSESGALFQRLLYCTSCKRFLSVHGIKGGKTKYSCENDHGTLTRVGSNQADAAQTPGQKHFCGQQLWEHCLERPIVAALDDAYKDWKPRLKLEQEVKDVQRRLSGAQKTLINTTRRALGSETISDADAKKYIDDAQRRVEEYELLLRQLEDEGKLGAYMTDFFKNGFSHSYKDLVKAERVEILHLLIRRIDAGKSVLTVHWAFPTNKKTRIERRKVMPTRGKKDSNGSDDEASKVVEIGGLEPPTSCMPCRRSPS